VARQRIIFGADTEQDADILAWLTEHPNKSAVIRQALRQAMRGATVDDLAVQMAELTARVESVQVTVEDLAVQGMTVVAGDNGKVASIEEALLPAEALANLDSLGNW